MRQDRAIRGILLLLFLLLAFPLGSEALEPGDKAPAFHVTTLSGKEISYDRDVKGKRPLYLVFWTTW